MMDAVDVIVHGLRSLLQRNPDVFRRTFRRGQVFNNETRGIRCEREPLVPWVHGHTIRAHLLAVNFTGLTGPLTFDPNTGQRAHYRLDVMALRFDDPLHKVVAQRFFTARCYASAVLAMGLCPSVSVSVSVCLSVTSRCSTKTAKRRITQTIPHDTPGTLVF